MIRIFTYINEILEYSTNVAVGSSTKTKENFESGLRGKESSVISGLKRDL